MTMDKTVTTAAQAVADIPDGACVMIGGFGGSGAPIELIHALIDAGPATGKPVAEFDGRMYVQERALKADFALIKAQQGDLMGNLTYRMAARNFNPVMATAAAVTIAQVSHVVAPGDLDPENVVTPGIFVNRVVHVPNPQQEEVLNRQEAVYP